jgi:hypothetical protein
VDGVPASAYRILESPSSDHPGIGAKLPSKRASGLGSPSVSDGNDSEAAVASMLDRPSSPYLYLTGSSPIAPSPSFWKTRLGLNMLTQGDPLTRPSGLYISSRSRARLIHERKVRRAGRRAGA